MNACFSPQYAPTKIIPGLMTMNKSKVLGDAKFGSRTAEDESDDLRTYFVETAQWRKILAGDVDVVFGAKGSGKSALYSLLVAQRETLRLGRRTIFLAAENPRGTPAFRDLANQNLLTEDQCRGLWKLYFLSIASTYLRHAIQVSRSDNKTADGVFSLLEANGLLAPHITLVTRLKATLEYLRKYLPAFEGKITEPNTGLEFSGKIMLAEPSGEQRSQGYRSLDELLAILDSAFAQENITCWLALDRLDVAFAENNDFEGIALRSLFRTYLDMQSLSNMKLKIFLRDDIWRRIVSTGFREASHVIRTVTLIWDQPTLLNLMVRRLASNPLICDHYGVHEEEIHGDASLQRDLFYHLFPDQVDIGKRQPSTLDWMLTRTADGSRNTAPRELVHLLNETRDQQLKLYQLGHADPAGDCFFDRAAIRSALPAVSKARYDLTLCAEYPALKPYLDKLEKERTEQNPASLAALWKVSLDSALATADKLVDAGFFERRGSKESPTYWVPFLYRDALNLVQGTA